MAKKQSLTLAKETIAAFGGVKATADALGVPLTTVASWQKSGIPAWRLASIRDAGAKLGRELPEGIAA